MTGYFGGYSQYSEEFSRREADVAREIVRGRARETGRPLVAQTMYPATPTAGVLRDGRRARSTRRSSPRPPRWPALVAAAAAGRRARRCRRRDRTPLDAGYFGARDAARGRRRAVRRGPPSVAPPRRRRRRPRASWATRSC